MTRSKPLLCFMAAAVGMVALAARGWACVPQPLVTVHPQASGSSGSEVTVEGVAMAGATEIRWNGVDGPRLATTTGTSFSVPVTIPPAGEGLYAIVAFERRPDGSIGSSGSAAFQVTPEPDRGGEPRSSPSTSTPAQAGPSPASSQSAGGGTALAVVGGVVLLALGALGGAVLSRRRRTVRVEER